LERIFSEEWWHLFVARWNLYGDRFYFSGLGQLSIEISDKFTEAILFFGSEGHLSLLPAATPVALRLSATFVSWQSFVRGNFTAIEGVLRGHIRIEGDAARLMPYVEKMYHLRLVAESL
jgi:putative sterol carrier protein